MRFGQAWSGVIAAETEWFAFERKAAAAVVAATGDCDTSLISTHLAWQAVYS